MTAGTKEQRAAAATAGNHGFSLISNEKLLELYTAMIKCRMIEDRVRVLLGQSKAPGSADAGHEAIAAGVAIDLLQEDTVVPGRGDLSISFIQGVPLASIFRSIYARASLPNLATQLSLARDVALANKMKKNGKIAITLLNEEPGSLDCCHEALTQTCDQQLPILFVSQNNPTAKPESLNGEAVGEEIALDAQTRGLPEIAVDGNDVVAVYRVATEAIAHARRGNGPTLIQCQVELSEDHDSILKMETYLARKGLYSAEMKLEVTAIFMRELDAAIQAAEALPIP
jgi:TPP-dependent pyruvate/acetoin dehydrogenase alpha subunit